MTPTFCTGRAKEAAMNFDGHIHEQSAFEPEAVRAMALAFEQTCNALKIFAGDEAGRRIIAVRIVDLARAGCLDPDELKQRILHEAQASL
jgi:hypothetical protein